MKEGEGRRHITEPTGAKVLGAGRAGHILAITSRLVCLRHGELRYWAVVEDEESRYQII